MGNAVARGATSLAAVAWTARGGPGSPLRAALAMAKQAPASLRAQMRLAVVASAAAAATSIDSS